MYFTCASYCMELVAVAYYCCLLSVRSRSSTTKLHLRVIVDSCWSDFQIRSAIRSEDAERYLQLRTNDWCIKFAGHILFQVLSGQRLNELYERNLVPVSSEGRCPHLSDITHSQNVSFLSGIVPAYPFLSTTIVATKLCRRRAGGESSFTLY